MIARLVLASAAMALIATQAQPRLASQLKEGMRLHYTASTGTPSTWIVGRVETGVPVHAKADCARYVVQKGAAPVATDSITQCISGDTLYSALPNGALLPARPVGPNMTIELKRPNGATNTFRTLGPGVDVIDGTDVPVIITIFTVKDSTGTEVQQLRERFAVSLGTATRGEFFSPSPNAPGRWRLQRSFQLERIERP